MAPQVPTYDSFQVAPEAMPAVRVADTQPGNGALEIGAGAQKLGNDLEAAAIRQQRQQNADQVFRAEAAVKDGYLQYEGQAKQRLGQDAWGVSQDTAKWWNDNLKTASDGLQNDEQRQIFGKTMEGLKFSSLGTMSDFEAQQRRVSVEESAKSSIQGSINIAAANPSDPSIVNGAKQDITKRVQALTNLYGWSPEIRDATQGQYLTNLHQQVIQSLVDTNPDQARAYFDANKDEINGANRDELDKQIRVGTIRQVGQQGSEQIISQGLGESQALNEARSKYTGQEQDEVVRRVKERYAEVDELRERGQRDAADKAWKMWEQGDKSLSSVPTSVLNSMDGKMRDALEKEDAAHASGVDIKTDWSTFYDLRQQAAQNPNDFANTDLRELFPKLNPAQREQLIDTQNQVKGNRNTDVQTLNEQLEHAHQLLGWTNADAQRKGQFDSATLTQIDADQKAAGGKKLTYDDRQKVIDRMMVNGSYPGGSWFSSNKFYQVAGTENAANFTPKIPDTDRQKIEAALQRRGTPITDDAVMKLYKLKNGLQ